ncbi:MAG TPA: LysM peptidoglycan-binding domain-containing protein [Kribbellaceae bacterium]|nr:LysM peptidoglycan-binding domain-containing protein [Kribbellaceae bacterium]
MSAVVAAPESTGTREATRPRRVALVGPTTESLPVRACSGEEIGWRPVADRPALRLTRRGRRLVTAVSALVFGAAVFVVGQQAVASFNDEPRFTRTTSVQVGAGQSLWSIAEETNPGVDPRVVIEEIADLNGLRSAADVIPGQTLVVPAP